MSQTKGIKIEVDVELKNKNLFKGFEKSLDSLLNKFNKISKQIDIINKKEFKLNADKAMQVTKAMPKAKITQPSIIEAPASSNKTDTKKSKGHLENIKSTLGVIDSFKSDSLSNAIKPLNNIFELKDKITSTFNGMKDKFNEIKDKAKELKSALVDATHTDGKFDLGKTIKFGAVTAGLLMVSSLYNDFTNHLATNEEAQKKWNDILAIGQEILALLGEVVFEFISTLLGFNQTTDDSKNKGELFNIILGKLKETAEKLKEKVQQLREWIDKNKDSIALWGDRIKAALPFIIALFVIFKLVGIIQSLATAIGLINAALTLLAANPIILAIILIVAYIALWVLIFRHLYNSNEQFRAGVDVIWNFIKELFSGIWEFISGVFQGFIDFLVRLWTENETLRNVVTGVWNFIKEHMFTIIGAIIGGPIGAIIGALIEFFTKNEQARAILKGVWDGIVSIVTSAITGIVEFLDKLVYRIGEVGKAWEAFKNADWKGVQEHVDNAITMKGYEANKKSNEAKEKQKAEANKKENKKKELILENSKNATKVANKTPTFDNKAMANIANTQEIPREQFVQLETQKQEISQEWLDTWNKFIESQTATIATLTEQWAVFFQTLYNTLAMNLALMSVLWTLFMLNLNLSYISLGLMTNLTIEGMKLKFGELIEPVNTFINKLIEAYKQISLLRINASMGIYLNFFSIGQPLNPQHKATGTNYFSGGLTTINERGDELILGPTGMVVANNPSTTNIMRDLAYVKGNLSQMNFRINGNSAGNSANNITLNIGNISNRSDIDYMMTQLSMLDLG
ncbi:MAG: hypothetical protein KBF12_06055 [Sebaldella sp.]|nr:hypothetical protein [Sebaldella sp.]